MTGVFPGDSIGSRTAGAGADVSPGGGLGDDIESRHAVRGGFGRQTSINPEGIGGVLATAAGQVEVGGEENQVVVHYARHSRGKYSPSVCMGRREAILA